MLLLLTQLKSYPGPNGDPGPGVTLSMGPSKMWGEGIPPVKIVALNLYILTLNKGS